ncbi:YbbC/YhhH family protein [Hymenobacter sp. BT190]|uniref:YbbC/YhhH family protein n=1 Tax=Hymenobacter sp. BT190 TaxID=2763505 RepID=UPI0016516466|nr:YbbC/YhhH family protein [Hymenobacter sp. BT190]MBC6699430.1 YbbC/YhhH family protein [Hymenobacter sp. BT190]
MSTSLFSFCIVGLLTISINSFAQDERHSILGREVAREELQEILKNKPAVAINTVGQSLPDSAAALRVAEPILFRTYGKKQILKQQPYEIYLIDNYWILMGTLPENWHGGTFTIVLNSQNGQIIGLKHGK